MFEKRILRRGDIYKLLLKALEEKRPVPPADWSVVKLDDEVYRAGKEFDSDPLVRQKDALKTALFYLADFALRMPERVDLSENTKRVREICENLSSEIEKITLEPDEVIRRRGKLKVWLKAILSVQTCLIYRDETERYIADEDERKRQIRLQSGKKRAFPKVVESETPPLKDKFSGLAAKILKELQEKQGEQPSLF